MKVSAANYYMKWIKGGRTSSEWCIGYCAGDIGGFSFLSMNAIGCCFHILSRSFTTTCDDDKSYYTLWYIHMRRSRNPSNSTRFNKKKAFLSLTFILWRVQRTGKVSRSLILFRYLANLSSFVPCFGLFWSCSTIHVVDQGNFNQLYRLPPTNGPAMAIKFAELSLLRLHNIAVYGAAKKTIFTKHITRTNMSVCSGR